LQVIVKLHSRFTIGYNSRICATFPSLAHTSHIDVAMQADKNYQKQLQKSYQDKYTIKHPKSQII